LAIGLYKIGLTQDSALPFIGELHHIDVGMPTSKLSKIDKKIFKVTFKDIKNIELPSLPKNSNKYQRGRTLLIAGSEKYPGAAYLALKGAISSGAGFISAVLPGIVAESIWQVAPEIVLKETMQSNQNGNASLFSALKNIDLSAFDSLAIGPGIGIDNDDWQKSKDYLMAFEGLLILDADALNRISESKLGPKFFLERKFKTWITPHSKEFLRLFPNIKGETKVEQALNAAKEFNIKPFGGRALMSMRLEKNWGAWTLDYRPDFTAKETGLDIFINWDKEFIGKDSAKKDNSKNKITPLIVETNDIDVTFNEAVMKGDKSIGYVTSGGFAHFVNKSIAFSYLDTKQLNSDKKVQVEINGDMFNCSIIKDPLYDPSGQKMRS